MMPLNVSQGLIIIKGWGYSVSTLDSFLLKLFEKYAELLKRRFSDDFQEVCKPIVKLNVWLIVIDCVYRRLHAYAH